MKRTSNIIKSLLVIALINFSVSCSSDELDREVTVVDQGTILSSDSTLLMKSGDDILDINLEFGPVNTDGELEYSKIHKIKYNFYQPLESLSETLDIKIAQHTETTDSVAVIVVSDEVQQDPPIYGRIITVPGYIFEHNSSCYIYGYYSYDTETGATSFTSADLATQSTMNNCNYGDVA